MRNIIKQVLKEEIDSRYERVKSFVNKYGFERAIELVVGGIDTIKQVYKDNPESFLDQFNDLTPSENQDYRIFYEDKDGNTLFMYYPNGKSQVVYINYERIWKFFNEVIGLKHSETKRIITNWLEETYNLKGFTPTGW